MENPTRRALIIFIKNPELGKVKTRLAAGIGDEAALAFYREMLRRTRELALQVDADRFLFYSEFIDRRDDFSNEDFLKYAQCAGDLGNRMTYAFSIPFKNQYKQVVIIGSDCPGLSTQHINDAFEALDGKDYVIGPATDGGYYLLGMKKLHRPLFIGKSWSTSSVFEDTRNQIEAAGAQLHQLEPLSDVDTKGDLVEIGDESLLSIAGLK